MKPNNTLCKLKSHPFIGKLYEGVDCKIITCCGQTNFVYDYIVEVITTKEQFGVSEDYLEFNNTNEN